MFAWWRMTRQVKIKVWCKCFFPEKMANLETKNGDVNIGGPFSHSREGV